MTKTHSSNNTVSSLENEKFKLSKFNKIFIGVIIVLIVAIIFINFIPESKGLIAPRNAEDYIKYESPSKEFSFYKFSDPSEALKGSELS